jgi:predicted GNAT superfamily acetyltransferase
MEPEIKFRECVSVQDFDECLRLQREVFALPETEVSPRRHFIVTKNAGGWTLGAFTGDKLIGFVLTVPAFRGHERAFYSHMTAVDAAFQGAGLGAKLKFAQRVKALAEGVSYIKWTFEPVKARNAYFNLCRLGAEMRSYAVNFYGTDYVTAAGSAPLGLDSDRLFAEWRLDSEKSIALAETGSYANQAKPRQEILIPADWQKLVAEDPQTARAEQLRIRQEFQDAFSKGLVCGGFARDDAEPRYLLF